MDFGNVKCKLTDPVSRLSDADFDRVGKAGEIDEGEDDGGEDGVVFDAVVAGFGIGFPKSSTEEDRGVADVAAEFDAHAGLCFRNEFGYDLACDVLELAIAIAGLVVRNPGG